VNLFEKPGFFFKTGFLRPGFYRVETLPQKPGIVKIPGFFLTGRTLRRIEAVTRLDRNAQQNGVETQPVRAGSRRRLALW
jgi:hypothetical protein